MTLANVLTPARSRADDVDTNDTTQVFEGEIVNVQHAGLWLARAAGRCFEARQAVSCLVLPDIGDRVLCARSMNGVFVLAILDRPAASPLLLQVRDRPQARLGFAELDVTARAFNVEAETARLAVLDTQLFGRSVRATLHRCEATVGYCRQKIGDLIQTARSVLRRVDVLERNEAKTRIDRVAGTLQIDADTAFISGRRDVRVDGERIHLG